LTRLPATKARADFAETLNRVRHGGDRIVLHRHGKDLAAIVSLEDLALIEAAEDRLDAEEARKALANPKRVPWSKVKAALGL
jgi:prevent-host-death family protein